MLFLTKNPMVAVIALGCLLSAPRVQAVDSPVSLRDVAAIVGAAGAVYLGAREVQPNNTKQEKALHVKALDTASSTWQSVLNFVASRKGLVALGGGAAVYAVVKHGSAVTQLPVVQTVLNQLKPTT